MTDKSFIELASMSDKALAEYIGAFIRHHRLERNMTQAELSGASGISRSTLSLLERGEAVTVSTLIQVLRVLDKLSVLNAFEVKESISPLALAKLQKLKRQRVRGFSKKSGQEKKSDW